MSSRFLTRLAAIAAGSRKRILVPGSNFGTTSSEICRTKASGVVKITTSVPFRASSRSITSKPASRMRTCPASDFSTKRSWYFLVSRSGLVIRLPILPPAPKIVTTVIRSPMNSRLPTFSTLAAGISSAVGSSGARFSY